jgi:hypothetical protein
MNYLVRLTLAAAALVAAAEPAAAGIYGDALSKCLVAKSSAADRTLLVQWIFGAMSTHPAVKDVAESRESRRKALTGEAAALFQRLVLEDCRAETVAAVRYDGSGALEASFGVLGQVAMSDLMANPEVTRELEALGSQMDKPRMEALMREATAPNAPAPH